MIEESSGDLWLAALVVVFCLLLSAFFSAGETAFTAASRARMLVLEKGGDRRARLVNRLLEMRERFIGTVLIGNNIVNIGVSAFATSVLVAIFGDGGAIYATIIMSILVIVFAEVLPKTLAITSPDTVSLFLSRAHVLGRGGAGAARHRHRAPGAAHAAALRHPDRRERADPLRLARRSAARSTSCTRKAASRRSSATCWAACSTSRI